MPTDCPNCRHRFNPTARCCSGSCSKGISDKIVMIFMFIMIVGLAAYLFFDYHHVAPPRQISFTAVALAVSGLKSKPTVHPNPVFDVVLKFTGKSNSQCLTRIATTVSYSNSTIVKSYRDEYRCYKTNALFAIEVMRPIICLLIESDVNLPSNLDRQKALFDVDMEFLDKRFTRNAYYHVSCKGLTLQGMETPVSCDTSIMGKPSL